MKVKIKDININYLEAGKGQNILILHGWGSSINVMRGMFDYLKQNNRTVMLDLPGFGESEDPTHAWDLDDYINFVIEFIKKLKIENPIIIGHSFGGRIAIKFAALNKEIKIKKIILIGSAGIKGKTKISFKTKVIKNTAKIFKKISPKFVESLKNKMGSTDYKSANPVMKEVLVNIISEDLTEHLSKITHSTLLIWGENDTETPYEHALIMNEHIKDSGIVKVENAGHYSFLDNSHLVHLVIDTFIGDDKK